MYKVGDKVKIREDLVVDKLYDKCFFNKNMQKFRGSILTIKKIVNINTVECPVYVYKVEEDYENWSFTDSMIEYLVEEAKVIKEKDMRNFKIVNYKKYEDKAVILEFDDGTEEKAVCCEGDKFEMERAVEVAVLKHIFGKEGYRNMLKTAMNQIADIDKAAEDKKKNEEAAAKKKAKNDARKARRREKKRAARVEEMKEAYLNAMKEYGSTNVNVDDLK